MKILYIITKANFGGAQRYVYDLATAAKAADHEPVVAYGMPGRLVELLQKARIRTHQITGLSRDIGFISEIRAFLETLRLLRTERPDVAHINSSKGGLALLAARIAGVRRIIFTAHGFAFNEDRPWWQKLIIRAIYFITLLLAHETICVSNAVARDVHYIPFARRTVIKNGMDAPKLRSRTEARAALNIPGDTRAVGMIAELHPTKRVNDAIEAIAEIPDLMLVVLGEGEARARLEKLIVEKGLTKRVKLPGFIAEAPTYLSAFDLFLVPSRTEALAYAAIEAGYAALPVIATNVGGLPEVVAAGKTGMLIPPCSPGTLANAIRSLIESPVRAQKYGLALKAHVLQEFSKERMVRETFEVYERKPART